jgi:hypothetical protein
MREQDRREIEATVRVSSMTEAAIISHVLSEGTCWTAWIDDQPVSAFGYSIVSPLQPQLRTAWAWGTDRFKRTVPAISMFCLEHWPPLLLGNGVIRVEIRALKSHDIAQSWLKSLRARYECDMAEYGTNGETFCLWSLCRSDWE